MKADLIRSRFLDYFAGHGHQVLPAAPLIPQHDPSLFFVNAGMVQFKDVFTGAEQRAYNRATTAQKCLRVSGKHNDLHNVGRTPRHHTLFEMLGNFSFGDYFKAEAIEMAWELLTREFQIDPERLWVTIFETDDEAFDLWRGRVGVPEARIQRLGAKENFWTMGDTGPCGPCTEIHYDHGPAFGPAGGPATDSPRYIEIWNLVFMQLETAKDGTRTPLPRPSIDTGMGLERLAAVLQGHYSNYDTDLFRPLIELGSRLSGIAYGHAEASDIALRVVADHARATAFLIADGVMPSNEGRGYVLRRIMRRAIRYGLTLGLNRPFFHHTTAEVIARFAHAYPELAAREVFIAEVVQSEEDRFRRTLENGNRLLGDALDQVAPGAALPGEVAFTLSDTYGFPLDLTELIASERQIEVDVHGFEQALQAQRARGRAAWKGSGEQAIDALWHQIAENTGKTTFLGYETTEATGTVLHLIRIEDDGSYTAVDQLHTGDHGFIVLDRTPCYGESGGQVGDTGRLYQESFEATLCDTRKAAGLHLHEVKLTRGQLDIGDTVIASADARRRAAIRRNHTATHLLHAALRRVLGEHVTQKGSLVNAEITRFDISHHKPVTAEELATVEGLVNEQILRNAELHTELLPIDQARERGAMALFGEKYDDVVRVVDVPGFSLELCGGTHVGRTGDIGLFHILSEGGVAAGVRRITAVTGHGALAHLRHLESVLAQASHTLKTSPDQLTDAAQRLAQAERDARREVERLQAQAASAQAATLIERAASVGGSRLLITRSSGDLRTAADALRDQLGSAVVVLAQTEDGKARLLVAATSDLAGKRVHAGQVIAQLAPLIGGRGGGRPDLAQAGGTDPTGIDRALDTARSLILTALGAS